MGALIEENTANDNGRNGIQAAPQATGEGNVATRNGAQNCVDIVCREEPPTDCPTPGSAGA